MSDLISRALLCGLGLASLTKDALQKAVEDLVNQSKISEEEGRRLVRDLHRRSAKAKKSLEDNVNAAVHTVFEHLDLPSIINDRVGPSKAPSTTRTRKAGSHRVAKRTTKRRATAH